MSQALRSQQSTFLNGYVSVVGGVGVGGGGGVNVLMVVFMPIPRPQPPIVADSNTPSHGSCSEMTAADLLRGYVSLLLLLLVVMVVALSFVTGCVAICQQCDATDAGLA